MLGSTNHLERLDPAISKRPSRFDRKYLFDNPDESQREAYCRYWKKKIGRGGGVEFGDEMCGKVVGVTEGFSFAYMQEAFVASLLAIARREGEGGEGLGEDVLWEEMQKQIEALREGLKSEELKGKN